MTAPFDVILADPPWNYDDKGQSGSGQNSGAEVYYETMTVADICALDVESIAAPDSLCFLWVTGPQMAEGFKVLAAWGFTFRTVAFTWVKTGSTDRSEKALKDALALRRVGATAINGVVQDIAPILMPAFPIGQGSYTRANPEYVLLGKRGRGLKRLDAGVRSEVLAPRSWHSRKPDEVHHRIDRLVGAEARKLEMFARRVFPAPNWSAWGNEVTTDVQIGMKGVAA